MSKRKRPPVPDYIRAQNEEEITHIFYQYEDQVRIEQYSKYHFRIFTKSKDTVDVWPVRKKYYGRGMNGSKTYDSIDEIIEFLKLKKPCISSGWAPHSVHFLPLT